MRSPSSNSRNGNTIASKASPDAKSASGVSRGPNSPLSPGGSPNMLARSSKLNMGSSFASTTPNAADRKTKQHGCAPDVVYYPLNESLTRERVLSPQFDKMSDVEFLSLSPSYRILLAMILTAESPDFAFLLCWNAFLNDSVRVL